MNDTAIVHETSSDSTFPAVYIALPPELWGKILSFMTEYDLWVSCRNVSRLLRTEAEREMQHERLCRINFRWTWSCRAGPSGGDEYNWLVGECGPLCIAKFSDDGARVHIDLETRAVFKQSRESFLPGFLKVSHSGGYESLAVQWSKEMEEDIRTGIFTSDVGYDDGGINQRIFIGNSVNTVELSSPTINMEHRRLSFLWKPFLTSFFAEELYVKRARKAMGKSYADLLAPLGLKDLHEKRLVSHSGGDTWIFLEYLAEEQRLNDELFMEAFDIRRRKAHVRAGLPFHSYKNSSTIMPKGAYGSSPSLAIDLEDIRNMRRAIWL